MNKQNTQTGSAHVILIIILIVVILGGLGFVAYRALSKPAETKKAASSTSQAQTKSDSSETAITDSSDAEVATKEPTTLALDKWNATITIANPGDYYVKYNEQTSAYSIYNKPAVAACAAAPDGVKEPMSNIIGRNLLNDKIQYGDYDGQTYREYYSKHGDFKARFVGDYVYVDFGHGSSPCADPTTASGKAAIDLWSASSASVSNAFQTTLATN